MNATPKMVDCSPFFGIVNSDLKSPSIYVMLVSVS